MTSSRIAIAFVLATCAPSLAAEAPLTGVEYKLRLAPDLVSDETHRKALWALLGAKSADAEPKNCRLVQFLDVAGDGVQDAGFIVRHRAKLEKEACPGSIPNTTPKKGRDLTVKFRSRDGERAALESKAPWMKAVDDHKLEQDVGIASAGDGRLVVERMFSASAKVDADVPASVEALRSLFPGVASQVHEGALSPGCRRIFEESWKLTPKSESGLPAEIDLTSWYGIAKNGKRSAAPMVAELSFKADPEQPETMARATALMDRLVRTIDPTWLAPGGSKTEAAAACKSE